MYFLLVLIELFSLGVTAKALRTIIGSKGDFAPTVSVNPKFQVEGVTTTNHSSSQKTRLNVLSYDIKICDLSPVLSKCTRLTDGQTDSFLVANPRCNSILRGNKQKNEFSYLPRFQ